MRPSREEASSVENYAERLEVYISLLEERISELESSIGKLYDDLTRAKDGIGMVLYRYRWATETNDIGICDCDTCKYATGDLWCGDAGCSHEEVMTPVGWEMMERGACPLWEMKK